MRVHSYPAYLFHASRGPWFPHVVLFFAQYMANDDVPAILINAFVASVGIVAMLFQEL